MFIVSKDRRSIINTDQVTTIFVIGSGGKINVNYATGNGSSLGAYETTEKAKVALMMTAKEMGLGRKAVYFMPSDEETEAYMAEHEQRYRHIDGKKAHGKGGS